MVFLKKIRYHEIPNISPGLPRVINQFLVCLYTGESLYMKQLLGLETFTGTCVSWPLPWSWYRTRVQFVLAAPSPNPQSIFTNLYPSDCIYRLWLIRIGNNKIQRVHIMLVFLFLLPNSFVTVKLDSFLRLSTDSLKKDAHITSLLAKLHLLLLVQNYSFRITLLYLKYTLLVQSYSSLFSTMPFIC